MRKIEEKEIEQLEHKLRNGIMVCLYHLQKLSQTLKDIESELNEVTRDITEIRS